MEIYKLIEYSNNLERGNIIRCKGEYPYEDVVDFIVCESYEEGRGYALYVNSGYKAGIRFIILPETSLPEENQGYAIDVNWLKTNWHDWGYTDCSLENVWIIVNSDIPKLPI